MSVSNGIITAPVSIDDVNNVLGHGSTDLGTLCMSSKINKWSRYKPVQYSGLTTEGNPNWYRARDSKCGLTIPITTSRSEIVNMYNNGTADWTYNPPTGGEYPFRLLDFDKYQHNATAAIGPVKILTSVPKSGRLTCAVIMNQDNIQDSELKAGGLSLSEIYVSGDYLSNWYFGGIITDTNNNIKIYATGRYIESGENKGNYTHDFPEFKVNSLTVGSNYYFYPIMGRYSQGQDNVISLMSLIPLPGATKQLFSVISDTQASVIKVTITAKYVYSGSTKTGITGTITITNTGASSEKLTTNYVWQRFATSNDMDAMQQGEYRTDLGDFSVPGNSSKSFDFSFNILPTLAHKAYVIIYTLDASKYTGRISPFMETMEPI